jgi:predicted ATPase
MAPNASGKSNLIEAIGLLKATPIDLTVPIRKGGGIREWLWKGSKETPIGEIEVTVDYPKGKMPLSYRLGFTIVSQRMEIVDEVIRNDDTSFYDYKTNWVWNVHLGGIIDSPSGLNSSR